MLMFIRSRLMPGRRVLLIDHLVKRVSDFLVALMKKNSILFFNYLCLYSYDGHNLHLQKYMNQKKEIHNIQLAENIPSISNTRYKGFREIRNRITEVFTNAQTFYFWEICCKAAASCTRVFIITIYLFYFLKIHYFIIHYSVNILQSKGSNVVLKAKNKKKKNICF